MQKKDTSSAQKQSGHKAGAGAGLANEKKSGKFIFANGDEYEGEYEQRMITEDGTAMVHAVERSGKGRLRCANGTIYEGNWLRDKLNGPTGSYSHPSGCNYQGEFKDGLFEGQGVYKWPSGATYEGQFKAGRMEGKGTFTDESQEVWVGSFGKSEQGSSNALLRFRLNI